MQWPARVALLLLAVLAGAAEAPAQEAVPVRGGLHEGYGRVVFAWDSPVRYEVARDGRTLSVRFGRAMATDLGRLTDTLDAYLEGAQLAGNGRVVRLTLRQDYKVRDFTVGPSVVLDLVTREDRQQDQPAQQAPDVPALNVRTGAHTGFSRIVFDWQEPVQYKVKRDGTTVRLTFDRPADPELAPVRRNPPQGLEGIEADIGADNLTVALSVAEDVRIRHFLAGPRVAVDLVQPPETRPSQDTRPAEAPDVADTAAAPAGDDDSAAPEPADLPRLLPSMRQQAGSDDEAEKDEQAATEATATAGAGATGGAAAELPRSVTLSFEWSEPASAAVFRRAGWLWIVFDSHQSLDMKRIQEAGGPVVRRPHQLPLRDVTVLRLKTAEGYNPSLRRDGLLWIVDLMRQPMRPGTPMEVQTDADTPVGERVFIPVSQAANPMNLQDPATGDRITVIPVYPLNHGIHPEHVFPEFSLPVTAQGVLVTDPAQALEVRSSQQGVEFISDKGLSITRRGKRARAYARLGGAQRPDLLAIGKWARGGMADFLANQRKLRRAAALAPPGGERRRARLKLARFLTANGFGPEALGILEVIARNKPAVAGQPRFKALRGAARYLSGRFDGAIADLGDPQLADSDVVGFWLAAARAKRGDPGNPVEGFRDTGAFLQGYPRALKLDLAFTAAETAIRAGAGGVADGYMEVLQNADLKGAELSRMVYLQGLLQELSGDFENAINKWDTVIDNARSREYRAKAVRDRAEMLYNLDRISRKQLIKELASLRYAWRGGPFEFRLLKRLGELYLEAEAYRKALRTLKTVTIHFRDRADVDRITGMMEEAFRTLYLDGAADRLSPLRAIALFNEFRELTPPGKKGDKMIQNLAGRLVGVDLLDQAAQLLNHQVRFRLKGENKARVGARLAFIHLLDQEPAQALEALDNSTVVVTTPKSLQARRRHLRARALGALGRIDEARSVLEGDTSRDAWLVRAEINWNNKAWTHAAEAYAHLVPPPDAIPEANGDTGGLTERQGRYIVNWATALAMAGKTEGLNMLYDAYNTPMQETPYAGVFDLLTAPAEGGTVNFRKVADTIQSAERFQAFMQKYRERLKEEGLGFIQ